MQKRPCSCAEFMAEAPVKHKGRSRKPQRAASSLVRVGTRLEQEPEAVGSSS